MFCASISIFSAAILLGLASCQICSYSDSSIEASWKVVGGGALQISFKNKFISNEQFTAVAFGESMMNLDIVAFRVFENKASVMTGKSTGYKPPTMDNQLKANVQSINYSGNTLNAIVTISLNFNGRNLENCQTWNFVEIGRVDSEGNIKKHAKTPAPVKNVCAAQCK